jgi:hypothetical protein
MPLNAQHCHTDLMKIAQFVLSFSTPTFTVAHEGFAPFLYNNWPLKNQQKDVTAGVGLAITDREMAASDPIRNMFRMKGTSVIPTPDQMRHEFDRVNDIERTKDNLYTDYRDKSPMEMAQSEILKCLREKMLSCWSQRGSQQQFPDIATLPAQAQVALMSYNYGARLSSAPAMCNAVKKGDFATASKESFISGWAPEKNAAHARLFDNAMLLAIGKKDISLLPPRGGPFKPPPSVPYPFPIPPMLPRFR